MNAIHQVAFGHNLVELENLELCTHQIVKEYQNEI
jgi:hypothetical protein